jgi:hypothetical protein
LRSEFLDVNDLLSLCHYYRFGHKSLKAHLSQEKLKSMTQEIVERAATQSPFEGQQERSAAGLD